MSGHNFLHISDTKRPQRIRSATAIARKDMRSDDMGQANDNGYFFYTPITCLLRGLCELRIMVFEAGLEHDFNRHRKLAQAHLRKPLNSTINRLQTIKETRA